MFGCLARLPKPRHVYELDAGGNDLARMKDLCKAVQPLVGDLDDGAIGLHRAGGVAADLDASAGKRVEESGLAGKRQADDANRQRHGVHSQSRITSGVVVVCKPYEYTMRPGMHARCLGNRQPPYAETKAIKRG